MEKNTIRQCAVLAANHNQLSKAEQAEEQQRLLDEQDEELWQWRMETEAKELEKPKVYIKANASMLCCATYETRRTKERKELFEAKRGSRWDNYSFGGEYRIRFDEFGYSYLVNGDDLEWEDLYNEAD